MITLKCKMCGGALEIADNTAVAECEYCGTGQTLPKLDDDKKTMLFDRANAYRANSEFDKAALIYENILSEAPDEAEAYWGLCLCKYGIEYVVDPRSKKRVPTCHRAQFRSILEDSNYLAAIENADVLAQNIYRSEAEYIDKVQKGILAISSQEEPFDIFICYKETDENGERTVDSVIAQDIYDALTNAGYRVFFSRITLEDKIGSAYEPHIFAALNSARVMLVVGTKPEYFDSAWVKNEWGRYLSLIEQGEKKFLIPCYRNVGINELPGEFRALQAQDVSKVGYMQDLLRGIDKIFDYDADDNDEDYDEDYDDNEDDEYNPPELISYVNSIGAQHQNDFWPNGSISSVINKSHFDAVSFQIYLYDVIGYSGDATLDFTVYDEFNNVVSHIDGDIEVEADNDRFAQTWVLNGQDGSTVNDGIYTAVFRVNDSADFEYKFRVVSDTQYAPQSQQVPQYNNYSPKVAAPKNKSLLLYMILCVISGYAGGHSFYARHNKKGTIQLILFIIDVSAGSGFSFIWMAIDFVRALYHRRIPGKK